MRRPWHGWRRFRRGRNGILHTGLDRMFQTPRVHSQYYNSPASSSLRLALFLTHAGSDLDYFGMNRAIGTQRQTRRLERSLSGSKDLLPGVGCVAGRPYGQPYLQPPESNTIFEHLYLLLPAGRLGRDGIIRAIGSENDEPPTDDSRPYRAPAPDLCARRAAR